MYIDITTLPYVHVCALEHTHIYTHSNMLQHCPMHAHTHTHTHTVSKQTDSGAMNQLLSSEPITLASTSSSSSSSMPAGLLSSIGLPHTSSTLTTATSQLLVSFRSTLVGFGSFFGPLWSVCGFLFGPLSSVCGCLFGPLCLVLGVFFGRFWLV